MREHVALYGLCLAVCWVMAGMGLAGAALPAKFLGSGGTAEQAGWLSVVYALACLACQYPAGRLADRIGGRIVLAVGFGLMALSALACREAASPLGLYGGRFLQGAGEAPVWSLAPALLGRRYPARRGWAMGLYNAAFHIGLMAGPALGAILAALDGFDPFLVFCWASMGAGSLAVISLSPRFAPTPVAASTPAADAWGQGKRCRVRQPCGAAALRLVGLAVPVYGAAYGLLTSSFPVAVAASGQGQAATATMLFCAYAGVAVWQAAAGSLSDRLGRKPFFVAGLVALAVGLAATGQAGGAPGPVAALLLGSGLGLFGSASLALWCEARGRTGPGRAAGLYFTAWGAGYCLGPLAANAAGPADTAIGLAVAAAGLALPGWYGLLRSGKA